jgi:hypothetical protein
VGEFEETAESDPQLACASARLKTDNASEFNIEESLPPRSALSGSTARFAITRGNCRSDGRDKQRRDRSRYFLEAKTITFCADSTGQVY